MRIKILFTCIFIFGISIAFAQFVGIGTSIPAAPLDIVSGNNWDLVNGEGDIRIGNSLYRLKIGLATAGGGAGATGIMQYGQPGGYNVLSLGSQGNNILQLNGTLNRAGIGTDNPAGKLSVFSAGSFAEPQVHIRQSNLADYSRIRMQTDGSYYWDIGAFTHNVVGNDRLNFYSSRKGDVLTLTGNGFVGIGNSNPNTALSFPATLGKKISFYPGGTGDAGIAMSSNRLQVYSDNSNADVAIGYDNGGTFVERFAVKANGALAVNGNMGNAGQVITSAGNNNTPLWKSPTNSIYLNSVQLFQTSILDLTSTSPATDLPGMSYSFSTTTNAKAMISFNIITNSSYCFGCAGSTPLIFVYVDNNFVKRYENFVPNSRFFTISGTYLAQLAPGSHTIKLSASCTGDNTRFWGGNSDSNLIVQLFNE